MPRKLLIGFAPILATAAFVAASATAQATPQFYINGVKAGTKHEQIVNYGGITLENAILGKIKCQNLAAGNIWNESEKGFANTEGYTTYGCTSEPTCAGVFATAEKPLEVTEVVRENPETKKTEKVKAAERAGSTLPWSGEVVQEETGEKLRKIKTHGIKVTIVAPCFQLEVPFEGALEPIATNGAKNGLHASHLTFEGKGGKTGFLVSPVLPSSSEENVGYTIGEVKTSGTSVELINAE